MILLYLALRAVVFASASLVLLGQAQQRGPQESES